MKNSTATANDRVMHRAVFFNRLMCLVRVSAAAEAQTQTYQQDTYTTYIACITASDTCTYGGSLGDEIDSQYTPASRRLHAVDD